MPKSAPGMLLTRADGASRVTSCSVERVRQRECSTKDTQLAQISLVLISSTDCGAAGGIRTHTSSRTMDFEAIVSAVPPPPRRPDYSGEPAARNLVDAALPKSLHDVIGMCTLST